MNVIKRPLSQFLTKVSRSFYCTSKCTGNEQKPSEEASHSKSLSSPKLKDGPPLEYFLANSSHVKSPEVQLEEKSVSYLDSELISGVGRKVYFETYGCQMNVNDTEVAWGILQKNGFKKTDDINACDAILVMTCAIRDRAEQKIWNRLKYYKTIKREHRRKTGKDLKIGILGCMAERLKQKILEKEKMVDLVCGPDAYRDLPHMLAVTHSGQTAVNVVLSMEETYADVVPVRLNENSPTAFVSIMRGCDNMCTYCIVPFTRGRERSRPISSILQEIKALSDMGIKQVTLLGQNVNSYRDMSELNHHLKSSTTSLAQGFKTVYKTKVGGRRFADLLEKVSEIDPEMRIRFTAPHPKDFPDEVLYLIRDRPNICRQLHLPAQSGSTRVLEAMRRGYSKEAYLHLVDRIHQILPGLSLSSDFIAGFCGETEEDHQQTVELLRLVKYDVAYCFPYSMREKTAAFHRLQDDVPEDVKKRRHMELAEVFREEAAKLHSDQHGQTQLVLIEGNSKKSAADKLGRNDANVKVIVPGDSLPECSTSAEQKPVKPGDYIMVEITGSSSEVLKGRGLYHTTLQGHESESLKKSTAVG